MIFLFSVFLANIPIGVSENDLQKYVDAIDEENQIFRCFSDNKQIPLKYLNDNFLDCSDGSDEPGTSAITNGTFYCRNKGYVPKTIPKWSVSDGSCDCCDGSDELFNKRVNCPNTCETLNKERENIFVKIRKAQEEGVRIKKERLSKIDDQIKEMVQKKRQMKITNKKLEQFRKELDSMIYKPKKATNEDELNEESLKEQKDQISNEDNSNQNNDINQEENTKDETIQLPSWRQYLIKLWKYTFFVPDYKTQKFSKSYAKKLKKKTQKIIDNNRKEITDIKSMVNYTRNDIEKSLALLYGNQFKLDSAQYKVLKELRYEYGSVGKYQNTEDNIQYFIDGDYNYKIRERQKGTLSLICWNEEKLISLNEKEKGVFHGYFATPAACGESAHDLGPFEDLDVDELKTKVQELGLRI